MALPVAWTNRQRRIEAAVDLGGPLGEGGLVMTFLRSAMSYTPYRSVREQEAP